MPKNIKISDEVYALLRELKFELKKDSFSQVIKELVSIARLKPQQIQAEPEPKQEPELPYPREIIEALPEAMEFLSVFVDAVHEILTGDLRVKLAEKLTDVREKAPKAQFVLSFFDELREGATPEEALKKAREVQKDVSAKMAEKAGKKAEKKPEKQVATRVATPKATQESEINFEELADFFISARKKAKTRTEKELYSYLHDAALLKSVSSICRLYGSAKKKGISMLPEVEEVLSKLCE